MKLPASSALLTDVLGLRLRRAHGAAKRGRWAYKGTYVVYS